MKIPPYSSLLLFPGKWMKVQRPTHFHPHYVPSHKSSNCCCFNSNSTQPALAWPNNWQSWKNLSDLDRKSIRYLLRILKLHKNTRKVKYQTWNNALMHKNLIKCQSASDNIHAFLHSIMISEVQKKGEKMKKYNTWTTGQFLENWLCHLKKNMNYLNFQSDLDNIHIFPPLNFIFLY